MTCKTGGGPVWTHNTIVGVWSECLSQLHVNHKKETRERYCDCEDRPDIAIMDPVTGTDVELDVSLAHPWCADILSRAARSREDGAAAVRREEESREVPVEGPAWWIMSQLRASSYGTLRSLGETSTIIPVSIISTKEKHRPW